MESKIKRRKITIATVRVTAKNEEDEDAAMEFEFTDKDQDKFCDWLQYNPKVIGSFEWTGNAFSIKTTSKKIVEDFQALIQKSYPNQVIGIEWGYWID